VSDVAAPTYVPHPGDAVRDRDVVIDLWRGNLGQEERLAPKFDWFYLGCPWGEPLLQLLRHEPSAAWVGVAGAGPRRMLLRGRDVSAGVLVDLAVSAEHRSLGPALMLQKAMMLAGGKRFDLLYGFPNPKAAAVFARVGYAALGEMVRYACVLRHRVHLERRMPRVLARPLGWVLEVASHWRAAPGRRRLPELHVEWRDAMEATDGVEAIEPRIDELWARSDHGEALIAPRDSAMLRWRFDGAPSPKTRKLRYLLLSEPSGGRLSAWFACHDDGRTLHVRDFWSVDAAQGIGRPFIEAMLREARREGYATVSVEYAGPAQRRDAWTNAGFVARMRRPIVGKWTNPETGGGDVHLTSADEDE
jgi:GNAT superfamily N-acetyltransferase